MSDATDQPTPVTTRLAVEQWHSLDIEDDAAILEFIAEGHFPNRHAIRLSRDYAYGLAVDLISLFDIYSDAERKRFWDRVELMAGVIDDLEPHEIPPFDQ